MYCTYQPNSRPPSSKFSSAWQSNLMAESSLAFEFTVHCPQLNRPLNLKHIHTSIMQLFINTTNICHIRIETPHMLFLHIMCLKYVNLASCYYKIKGSGVSYLTSK